MLILWETGSKQLMNDANRNVAAVGSVAVVWTFC